MNKILRFTLSTVILLTIQITVIKQSKAQEIGLNHLKSIQIGGSAAAEIVAYDEVNNRLWVLNSPNGTIDVFDFSDYMNPTKVFAFDFSIYGPGVTHIDIFNEIVAISLEADPITDPGKLVLIKGNDYTFFDETTVGSLPDMCKFTHDGTKILVANEGEPANGIDPEGSVSIIEIDETGIINNTTVSFESFNAIEASLRNRGIRIYGDFENPASSVAQDLEPEYVTILEDDQMAYVSCQENNCLAVINIAEMKCVDLLPLGYKNHEMGEPMLQQIVLNQVLSMPVLGTPVYEGAETIYLGGFSGLYFDHTQSVPDQKAVFYMVPDRGPNEDVVAKANVEPAVTQNLRPFKLPDYQARIVKVVLDNTVPSVTLSEDDYIYLTQKDGVTPISGKGNVPGTDEIPVTYVDDTYYTSKDYHDAVADVWYSALEFDPYGGDFEGIVRDKAGNFWLCDEYRPSIYKFSPDGVLIERFVPEGTAALNGDTEGTYGAETLPEVYSKRWANRGFEGIAYDSVEQIIYAFIQSPMYNPNSSTQNKSDIIRILGVNLDGTPVAEYVYLLERNRDAGYALGRVDKIGDACYMGNKRFVVLERDSSIPGDDDGKKYVFMVDLNGATNILGTELSKKMTSEGPDDKTLEMYTADDLVAADVHYAYKTKLLNLPSVGYMPSDKSEGIAFLPDGTLAVMNDNDFGLAGAGVSDNSSLGIISFAHNYGYDASDKADLVNITPHQTWGAYQPDHLGSFTVDGKYYVITVNEGDARDAEEARVKDLVLNPDYFPNAAELQNDTILGRQKISMVDNDINGDGMIEYIHGFGARSFSVRDQYGNLIFDSGDDIEQTTFEAWPNFFNCDYDDVDMVFEYKARSDDKGPEPEGMTMGYIGTDRYAFIGLERQGGIMMYNVNNPKAPVFVDYVNTSDFPEGSGDISPEGLIFISADNNPSGKDLLVVGYEMSGSVAIFSVGEVTGFEENEGTKTTGLVLYPNPSNRGVVFLNKPGDISVYSINGQLLKKMTGVSKFSTSDMKPGLYLISDTLGNVQKLIITN